MYLFEQCVECSEQVCSVILVSSRQTVQMGRAKSVLWNAVIPCEDDNKKVKCKACGLIFAKNATRIYQHLTGIQGEVRVCTQQDQIPPGVLHELRKTELGKRKAEDQSQKGLQEFFAGDKLKAATGAVADAMYACGLPFNLAR